MTKKTAEAQSGLFFVIEGSDGSGKTAQFQRLLARLSDAGHDVVSFDFPQYDRPSSYFVQRYLNGEYGGNDDVGPYTGSMFYALDRYEASFDIRKALSEGKIVVCNRFTGSNMAHQGAKIKSEEERRGYFLWLDAIEFKMLNIPRPDLSVVLHVPAETAQKLVSNKDKRSYTDKTHDLHEADLDFLSRSVDAYRDLCRLFPKDYTEVDCMRDGELMSIDDVHTILWQKIQPLLPSKSTSKPGTITSAKTESHFVVKDKAGHWAVTTEGKSKLDSVLTNSTDDVYAFKESISPITVAAAMARLSRRGDDMRITLLDEFMGAAGKDENLLKRVITAYGDDSVQQLVGQHVVVENASNLLTKKLEWGRLASYLEQSTRYIYFDQKDKDGKYRYVVPEHFDMATKKVYVQIMDEIFDNYSVLVRDLTEHVRNQSSVPADERDVAWQGATRAQACDAARPVLPVATKSTVGIYASGQALESLIMHLLSDELPEAQVTGQKLLHETRKVIPTFLERADKPERGGAWVAYRAQTANAVSKLAESYLDNNHSVDAAAVKLTSVWPRNELDAVPDMLYEHAHASLQEINDMVQEWPYARREEVFQAYMGDRLNRRHRPGRAIEKIHYSFDLLCDYGIFRDLQRHRMVDDLNWQLLSPRYGYETPQLVEDAGMSELYEKCFDLSLKLYSALQEAGYGLEAQYATLLGHKMRWKVTLNAREAFQMIELRTTPQGHPGYRKLAGEMYQKICDVHPLIGEAMKFVNQDEDPELTRLAAERYTQFKLNSIK